MQVWISFVVGTVVLLGQVDKLLAQESPIDCQAAYARLAETHQNRLWNFHAWNWFFEQETGLGGIAPEDFGIAPDLASRDDWGTLSEWYEITKKRSECGIFPPQRSNLPQGFQYRGFEVGVTHIDGKYGFEPNNFLVEGAKRAYQLGFDSIFLYLHFNYRIHYPDRRPEEQNIKWPAVEDIQSLSDLIESDPYHEALLLPFKTVVLTVYGFQNQENFFRETRREDSAALEKLEIYKLTKKLLKKYKGTGKIFVLKNWEGDWFGLRSYDGFRNMSQEAIEDMIQIYRARQEGVEAARREIEHNEGVDNVFVYHAVEVNRVLDVRRGLNRLINKVVPYVGADLVAYSSYDAFEDYERSNRNFSVLRASLSEAFSILQFYAPDPLNLGPKRILVTEIGVDENRTQSSTADTVVTAFKTFRDLGASGGYFWQLYDNECTGSSPGQIDQRPSRSQCRGFWVLRPDGSLSTQYQSLKGEFHLPQR